MKLYGYFRSSAAYRVRIALNLKDLDYEYVGVHLLCDGGEQLKPEYRALNPDDIVPAFVDGDDVLPQKPLDRAFVRSVALQVACKIHPLDNLRVLKYLKHQVKVPDETKDAWYCHWVETGFASLETRLSADPRVGELTFGDTPTIADLCIVPRVFNARRFGIDLSPYPTVERIADRAGQLEAFAKSAPAVQPDAE